MAHALFRIIGRPEWSSDPRYATLAQRCQRNDEVCDAVANWCRHLSADEIQAPLAEAGIPVERVRSPAEAIADPLLHSRGEITDIAHPEGGVVPGLRTFGLPIGFDGGQQGTASAAPRLGEHNDLIYRDWLGFSEQQLREWKTLGVI